LSKNVGDVPQQSLTSKENAAIIAALFEVEVKKEKKVARQVAALQVVSMLVGASIAYSINGTPQFAIAVLSGGGVSVLNGSLLAWRMSRAAMHPAHDAHHQLRLMYVYAAERFLVVVALLGLCLAALRLSPLAVLGGFVMGQAVLLTARLFLSKFKTEIVTKNV
jgi:hypothetical protein